jgi:hypothetical protein
VVRILTLISDPPNPRSTAGDGDIEGDFDVWFDGGAVKHDTGISTWRFTDGAEAVTGTSLGWRVSIELADGRFVEVTGANTRPIDLALG